MLTWNGHKHTLKPRVRTTGAPTSRRRVATILARALHPQDAGGPHARMRALPTSPSMMTGSITSASISTSDFLRRRCLRARLSRRSRRCSQQPSLFIRRHQEHITHEKSRVVIVIISNIRRRIGHIYEPLVAFLLKQSSGHRCTGTNLRRVEQPTERPIRLQTLTRQKKIRRNRSGVMCGLARDVTLQARSSRRGENVSRNRLLSLSQRQHWLLNIRIALR